jgi:Na+/citrate or Na+/malate symporter
LEARYRYKQIDLPEQELREKRDLWAKVNRYASLIAAILAGVVFATDSLLEMHWNIRLLDTPVAKALVAIFMGILIGLLFMAKRYSRY